MVINGLWGWRSRSGCYQPFIFRGSRSQLPLKPAQRLRGILLAPYAPLCGGIVISWYFACTLRFGRSPSTSPARFLVSILCKRWERPPRLLGSPRLSRASPASRPNVSLGSWLTSGVLVSSPWSRDFWSLFCR